MTCIISMYGIADICFCRDRLQRLSLELQCATGVFKCLNRLPNYVHELSHVIKSARIGNLADTLKQWNAETFVFSVSKKKISIPAKTDTEKSKIIWQLLDIVQSRPTLLLSWAPQLRKNCEDAIT